MAENNDTHSKRSLAAAAFYITEQGTPRKIEGATISVDGVMLTGAREFDAASLKAARVEISAPGYSDFSKVMDLSGALPVKIQMAPSHRTYRFDVPLVAPASGDSVRFYIKTQKELTQSPLEGYRVTDDDIIEGTGVTNTLVYEGRTGRRLTRAAIVLAFVALVLGFLLGWGVANIARHNSCCGNDISECCAEL